MINLNCPVDLSRPTKILLGHGGGGELTQSLIKNIFYKYFKNEILEEAHDGALFHLPEAKMAMTTDSFVINPIFFKGGDIGKLSIIGTVNDLAMCGAKPLYITTGFILEEGFEILDLEKIVVSMSQEAQKLGVKIIAGDTKVVEKGKADCIFINTTGIGTIYSASQTIKPQNINAGDAIVISRDIGRHGIAIMSDRAGLEFETPIESDCHELWSPVQELLKNKIEIHCLRDLTRGGLATSLIELAESANVTIEIEEKLIPINSSVSGACEMLGLDPLFVANEGAMILVIPQQFVESTLNILKSFEFCKNAKMIGKVTAPTNNQNNSGKVILKTKFGPERALFRLSGEQLPRIC